MKILKLLTTILLAYVLSHPNIIYASDCPIIFVHGIQSDASIISGCDSWNDSRSAMKKILNEGYFGYKWGLTIFGYNAVCCDYTTALKNMPDSKRIYNFSYYNPDGSRGVIGSNGIYVPVNPELAFEYLTSAYNACWAEHLAIFIDEVLDKTDALKVDIVAHSMGGLVARSAITYYGCENKVRKLLTLGTPHHAYMENDFILALLGFFSGFKDWQKNGSLLEMGVDLSTLGGGTKFHIPSTPSIENTYCDFLYNNDPQITTSCVAGNKSASWSEPPLYWGDDNDGLVKVDQSHLDYAVFNPTVFAIHSRSWVGDLGDEYALTTSTYTEEFIKKWIIDDETYINASIVDETTTYNNPWPDYGFCGGLRSYVGVNSYLNVLSYVCFIYDEPVNLLYVYGLPLYKCSPGQHGNPVVLLEPGGIFTPGIYTFRYRINDMNHGEIAYTNEEKILIKDHNYTYNGSKIRGSFVNVEKPISQEYLIGDKIWIKWASNEYVLSREVFFSTDGGNTYEKIFSLDPRGPGIIWTTDSVEWVIPIVNSGQCKIKVVENLDNVIFINDESETFTIITLSPPENVTLNYNGKSIRVKWYTSSGNKYYYIWRQNIEMGEPYVEIGSEFHPTYNTWVDYYDEDFSEGNHTFRYKIRGEHTDFSDYEEINFYHVSPPTDFQVEIINDNIELTWLDNSNLNIGYEIKRKDVFEESEIKWAKYQDIESEIDENVDPSHPAYDYWIRAFTEGWTHTSSWEGPVTAKFDETPPTVAINSPGQCRVIYKGDFTIKWNVSDDFGCGIYSQTISYPYIDPPEELDGNVRSKQVSLETIGKGSEEEIIIEATDYAYNTGIDVNTVVIVDPAQADILLNAEHDSDWKVTIYTTSGGGGSKSPPPEDTITFDRVYKGRGDNWEAVDLNGEHNSWQDPIPLNRGETRKYLVCRNNFNHVSEKISIKRPFGEASTVNKIHVTKEEKEEEIVYENYIRPISTIIKGNLILNASSNENKNVKIEVIDRIGRLMKREQLNLNRGLQEVNLGILESGVYFIKVFTNKEEIHKVTIIR